MTLSVRFGLSPGFETWMISSVNYLFYFQVERLLTAREESIAEARRMAETSARLRDILR